MILVKQVFLGLCVGLFLIAASEPGSDARRVGAALFTACIVRLFVARLLEDDT